MVLEKQQRMSRGHKHVRHRVLRLGIHSAPTTTTTSLRAILGQRRSLDIARRRDGDDHVFVRDQVLHANGARAVDDNRSARIAMPVLNRAKLTDDDLHQELVR